MTRRVAAGLICAVVALVLFFGFANRPTDTFTVFTPGPTFNALGTLNGKKVITVTGHASYPDSGQLRFVTVYVTQPKQKLSLVDAIANWIDPHAAVLPHDAVYEPNETNKSSQAQSAVQMSDSQDDATAVALTAAHIKYTTEVLVADVTKGGASDGILQKGDRITGVDGMTSDAPDKLVGAIQKHKPGSVVHVSILRNGTAKTVAITTRPDTTDKTKSRINVAVGGKYVFPFKVTFGIGNNIGGPSAGMMFALSVYDLLTPGSLTGGKVVAGSGEITGDGVVGPIGGIGQKLVGAENDGAKLFLVAKENCAEAAKAHFDRSKMRLVEVHTFSDAISAIEKWRADPNADLPTCG